MHFAPDTEDTLEFVVALGNTDPAASKSGDDEISTPSDLTELLDRYDYSGDAPRSTGRADAIGSKAAAHADPTPER